MFIEIGPQRLRALLFTAILVLISMHVVMLLAGGLPMPQEGTSLRARFNLGAEGNIPAKYATLQLCVAIGLLLLLFVEARHARRERTWHWLALAAVFMFLAVDEYYSIHERLSLPTQRLLGSRNVLAFAWVLPYAGLVAIFAAAFLRFWRDLPPAARRGVALAAVVYVGGAMGMEIIGSFISTNQGEASLLYALETLVEESMELFGIALFILALAALLRERAGQVTLQLDTRHLERHQELLQDIEMAERRTTERRSAERRATG
jgi:hypothetical protein